MDNLESALSEYPQTLTVDEAAEILRVSRRRVSDFLKSGDLRGYQPGSGTRWVIAKTDLIEYIRMGSNARESTDNETTAKESDR